MACSAKHSCETSSRSPPDREYENKSDEEAGKEEQAELKPSASANESHIDKQIFVSNIVSSATEDAITQFFTQFGAVCRVWMLKNKTTNQFLGRAFVQFVDACGAAAALGAKPEQLKFSKRRVYLARVRPKLPAFDAVREEGIQDAPVFMLIEDVMMYIMDLLPLKDLVKMERVCKSWRELSIKHWKRRTSFDIDEIYIRRDVNDRDIEALFRRGCPSMKVIKISNLGKTKELTNRTLKNIAYSCPKLEKLDISSMDVTNRGLMAVINACPLLATLHLQCDKITEPGLEHIFEACKELKDIEICHGRNLIGFCLAKLGQQMTSVVIQNCNEFSDTALIHLSKACPHLKRLILIHCPKLSGRHLTCVGEFLELELLKLSGTFGAVKPEYLMNITNCKNLEHLTIKRNGLFNDELIIAISKGCPNLKTLQLSQRQISDSWITNKAILSVAENCLKLKTLGINRCGKLTDESLFALARAGRLSHLKANNTAFEDKGVAELVDGCLELKELDIYGCVNITQDIVSILSETFKKTSSRRKCRLNINIGDTPSWKVMSILKLQNLPEGPELVREDVKLDELDSVLGSNYGNDSEDSDDMEHYLDQYDSDDFFPNDDDFEFEDYYANDMDLFGWHDGDDAINPYLDMLHALGLDNSDWSDD